MVEISKYDVKNGMFRRSIGTVSLIMPTAHQNHGEKREQIRPPEKF